MANVTLWNGSATFDPNDSPTPFGFYDNDAQFASEAPKVANYCATKLGWPMMDVELNDKSFFTCFEEAVTTYGNEVYQSIVVQNYLSLYGSSQAVSMNGAVIKPSLQETIRISDSYGMEAGVGGSVTKYTGILELTSGQQEYDLNQWAADEGILGRIEIRKIFYEAPPAILRYFDPYAGTGTGIQSLMDAFDFGSYSPGVNFLLMPASYDLLKVQAIEFNDQIRRSAYSFELVNNQLKLFPVPTKDGGKLVFEYYKVAEKTYVDDSVNAGGTYVGGGSGAGASSNPISTIFNVNFSNPTYSELNSIGKQWVYRYAAALAKEMLAYVRGKYQSVPVPGSEATLNQADLLTDARAEKTSLLEDLKAILKETSRLSQLEMKSSETKFLKDTLDGVPMTIYIA